MPWVPIPEALTKRNIPPRSGIPPQTSHETLEFQCLDIGIQVYNVLRYMEKGLHGVGHNVVSGEVVAVIRRGALIFHTTLLLLPLCPISASDKVG